MSDARGEFSAPLPFKRDIPNFPGETDTRTFPTDQTTQLDNPLYFQSTALLTRFQDPSLNSKKRADIMRDILIFCEEPSQLNYMKSFIESQLAIAADRGLETESKQAVYKSILEKIHEKYRPPEFSRLAVRCEPHGVSLEEYDSERKVLVDRMKSFFSKDEDVVNIFFQEHAPGASKGKQSNQDLIKEGFEKYGGFRKAQAYFSFFSNNNRPPTETELYDELANFDLEKISPSCHPTMRYNIMVYDALDEILKDGYNISLQAEEGTENLSQVKVLGYNTPEEAQKNIRTFDEFKRFYYDLNRRRTTRDQKTASQVTKLVKNAEATKQRTKIFMLLGPAHEGITQYFPINIRQAVEITSAGTGTKGFDRLPNLRQLQTLIYKNEPISTELWEGSFQDFKRASHAA
jgi:hypothetical protein